MLTLGAGEMAVIFILALVLFGPKKLPELGRTIAKAVTEFRRASNDLKATFEREMHTFEQESRSIQQATHETVAELSDHASYNYGLPSAEEVWNPLDYESRAAENEQAAIAPPAETTSEYGAESDVPVENASVVSESGPVADSTPTSSMPTIVAATEGTVPRTSALSTAPQTPLTEEVAVKSNAEQNS